MEKIKNAGYSRFFLFVLYFFVDLWYTMAEYQRKRNEKSDCVYAGIIICV